MAQIDKPSLHFNTVLYTGNGSYGHSITGVGFQPDWVWIKSRSGTHSAGVHELYDAVRGTDNMISSNSANAQASGVNRLHSFDSDGFTVDDHNQINGSSTNYVSWNWKANGAGSANSDGTLASTVSVNTAAGISIVKYTGNGSSGATVGHGLGAKPNVIILKSYENGQQWAAYWSALGATKYMRFNATSTVATSAARWNNTEPTTSVFTIGNDGEVNTNAEDHIAYCFTEKKGFSKFGIYKGRGSQSANNKYTFTYCGFKPAFVLVKNTQQGSDNWFMWDNKRPGYNQTQKYLNSNLSNAEADSSSYAIDFLSNAFVIRSATGAINNNNEDIIYMAFAEHPIVGSNKVPAVAR
tara:strand:+ start:2060 stop:3118 length:1059 start_codon:yes stop_codon:yes gene_type:complete